MLLRCAHLESRLADMESEQTHSLPCFCVSADSKGLNFCRRGRLLNRG